MPKVLSSVDSACKKSIPIYQSAFENHFGQILRYLAKQQACLGSFSLEKN
jgi:hypothetical protein